MSTALRDQLADRYRIERELGQGGMATVYLAQDLKHARAVALKVLRPELAATVNRERFTREVFVTARLQHAHILTVLESGETAGQLWYTMPYVEGESLRARMDREGQLSVDAALGIARDVSDALGYAHARDIVHRDVKPENILLAGGHAFVADFGIARALDEVAAERLTRTGIGLGTPHYMSPEQSLGERIVDGRTDLYALASVVYEMLAGEPPFDGSTAQAIIAKRLTQPAPSVRVLRETVPESVDRALMKALAKAPADRFVTTGEFVLALSQQAPAERGVTRTWRSSARTITLALVLAAGAGGAAWTAASRSSAVIDPASSVIAVMPFIPASGDTTLARLGRDLSGTISSSLDGVGDIRTIDRLTILAQVREGLPLPLADAATLARRLGASSVVHGTISRDGPRVRLDVNLLTTDSMSSIARGTVVADAENLGAMTDSVVWRLLADIWRKGTPPTPTLAAITTRSVEALRAYLDGERYLVAGDGQAQEAFGRAIAADSNFWFAYYRKGNAMGWAELDVDSATEATYLRHRDKLPPRDRMMITASRHDSGFARQRAQLEELVRRYPDYWPAWWILGDNLHHLYPQTIGSTKDDARKALERVVALNPAVVNAWQHLAQVYAAQRDTSGLARALENLGRLSGRTSFIKAEQVDHVLLLETVLALQRGRPSATETIDRVYDGTVKSGIEVWLAARFLGAGHGSLQIALDQRLLKSGLTPERTVDVVAAMGDVWAMRGAWDSAFAARDRLPRSIRDTSWAWALGDYQLAVAGAWAGALPAAEAVRRRPEAIRLAAPLGPGIVAELAWLDGLRAVATNDAQELAAARTRVTQAASNWSPRPPAARMARYVTNAAFLDRSLAAFDEAMRGDKRRAAAAMATLEWEIADSVPYYGLNLFLRGVDRLAAAEWIVTTGGDTAQALRLLNWHRAAVSPFMDKASLGPLAVLLAARIHDAQHDTATAIEEYNEFLRRFDAPVPAMRHLVSAARAALALLTRRKFQ